MSNNTTASTNTKSSYGWAVVGSSILLLFGSFGAQQCFGVFLQPLVDEFCWTRAAISGAMSVVMGISGLCAVIMGRLTDKYPVSLIIGIGVLVGGLAYFLLSSVNSIWQFYLYFGAGIGICVGSCYTPVNATVSKWFSEKRELAIGIAMLGITLGAMVLSPLLTHIILVYSWRTAYILTSIIVIVFAIPAIIIMRKTPPSASSATMRQKILGIGSNVTIQLPGLTTRESIRTASFWMIMITGFVISAAFYFVATHIVTYAIDTGMSATSAAFTLTIMSIGGIAGTLSAWWISVKLGNRYALLVLTAVQALVMFLFILIKSPWLFYAAMIFFGITFGAASPVRLSMIPQLFGINSVGTIMGLATFAWAIGGITGPILAGYIFDRTGSYNIAFLTAGLLLVIGVLSIQFLKSHEVK